MWISKKRYEQLEKRVADLESKVQGQHRNSESSCIEFKYWMTRFAEEDRKPQISKNHD